MQVNYFIVGIFMIFCGIVLLLAVGRLLISDIRIRQNGMVCKGKIVGKYSSKTNAGFSCIYPLIQIKESRQTLKSVRSISLWPWNRDEYIGRDIQVIYNPDVESKCTYGKMYSYVIESLIFLALAVLFIVTGVYSLYCSFM